MSEKQQRLVFAIIDFLNQSIEDGTVKADDQEGLEVASAFFLSICTFNARDRSYTPSTSPVHWRGFWCRSIQRGTSKKTVREACYSPEYIRCLHENPREGRHSRWCIVCRVGLISCGPQCKR